MTGYNISQKDNTTLTLRMQLTLSFSDTLPLFFALPIAIGRGYTAQNETRLSKKYKIPCIQNIPK